MNRLMLFVFSAPLFLFPAGALAQMSDLKLNEKIIIETPHTLVAPGWLKNRPVYMTIINKSPEDDTLTGASSPVAEEVILQYTHNYGQGVKTMRPLENQEIYLPPMSKVKLQPGGMHLMFTGLKQPLRLGLEVPVRLEFANSPAIYVKTIIQKQPD